MSKISTKTILTKLGTLEEYHYPIEGQYSLFLLPDGRLVGTDKIVDHQNILEKIIKRKIVSNQEFFDILVKIGCIKIIVNLRNLYVDISIIPTTKQKYTLQDLGICDKYDDIKVDNMHEYVPNAPSDAYGRHLLGLPFY